MESLDVLKDVASRFVWIVIPLLIDAFALEHSEEALAGCVVAAMANRAHAADQRVPAQESLVIVARELASAIRMQNYRCFSFALIDRHVHSADDHVAILPMMHRPPDHQLAVEIEHDAQVQLAFSRFDLGDVGDPLALGLQAVKSRSSKLRMPAGRHVERPNRRPFFRGQP